MIAISVSTSSVIPDVTPILSPSPPAFPYVAVKLIGPEQGDGHAPQEWNDNQATREPETRFFFFLCIFWPVLIGLPLVDRYCLC